MTRSPLHPARAWPLYAGMLVAGTAAVVASFSTLAELARAGGWVAWTPWLLPSCVDVGGAVGGWVWLRPGAPETARRFGRAVAMLCGAGSLVGNGMGHLIGAGHYEPGPVLIIVVGAVPAAILVALAHLAVLLTGPTGPAVPEVQQTATATARSKPRTAGPVGPDRTALPDRTNPDRTAGPTAPGSEREQTATRTAAASDRSIETDEDLIVRLRTAIKDGEVPARPGRGRVMAITGVGAGRAARLQQQLLKEDGDQDAEAEREATA